MSHLSELQLLRFLIELTVLLIVSRALGELMKRLEQAPIIGELLAGIVLGPGILGYFAPAAYATLFPADPVVMHLLEAIAWIGAIGLLLYIGLETDLGILRGMGRTVTMVAGFGITITLLCGLAIGYYMPAHYLAAPNQRLIFSLFMAVALSISAVPVIAKILLDLGLMRRELGMLILACGIVDDSVGWLMLSIVAGLAERGVVDVGSVSVLLLETALFIGFCYFAGRRLVTRLFRWVDDRAFIEQAKFTAMLAVALVCAILTQAIGIHAVFGAFVAGLMLNISPRLRAGDRSDLEAVTMGLLSPIFFAYSGLRADVSTLRGPEVAVVILVVGCAAKIVGCGLGGRLGGLKWREALAVAIGMNARGGMGIIVALIGLSLGVLTAQMYTVLLLFAVVTSLMTPPLLTWALGRTQARSGDAERVERDKMLTKIHLPREGAKLLVLTGGGPHAALAVHMAAALGSHKEASVTIFRAVAEGQPVKSPEFDQQFAMLKALAEFGGARHVHQRSATGETIADAVVEESKRGYDVIFAGASQQYGIADLGGEVLRELVSGARAPVVIVRAGMETKTPFHRVLAPTTGAAFSRLGAVVAMQYAQAFESRVEALFVREVPWIALPGLAMGRPNPGEGIEFVDDIRRLGEEFGVNVETILGTGRRPESVILDAVREGEIDLLVMGVLFRSSDQRLYFGPKVREILTGARCAVAVVVPPQPITFRG